MSRLTLGRAGEEQAAAFLTRKGYRIAARNYRAKVGEIDIIAWQDSHTLAFVEVKTRRGEVFGAPAQAVNAHKRRKIIMTAAWYLRQEHLEDCFCRFDVIEVYAMVGAAWRIRLYEGAFEM